MYIYLIGTSWYSSDQGDYPNTDNFPEYVETEWSKALSRFEELKKKDRSWSCGSQKAYLVQMEVGKQGHETLMGHL